MSQVLDPLTSRDFSSGRIAKTALSTSLMPNFSQHTLQSAVNSVSNSENVDFSEIIGSGIVRKGKQHIVQIGAQGVTDISYATPNSGDQLPAYGANWLAQTFTPSVSGLGLEISLQLFVPAGILGYATLRIQGVAGGLPNGVNLLQPVTFDLAQISQTAYPGAMYSFYLTVGQFISAGTALALVLSYPSGDITNNVEWVRNATTAFSGQASSSTNSGVSWSTATGTFCFIEKIIDVNTPYNSKPLGNFSFLNVGIGRNVVVFNQPVSTKSVLYYWDYASNSFPIWRASTLSYLSPGVLVRFANMNGSVFEANGTDIMHTSADNGATWGTNNAVFSSDQIIPSLLIVSGNRMLASGWSTYPSRIYFSSLVDPTTSPFITWNTHPTSGDFIDIDPDSGGIITGFAINSSLVLVFKNNAMYRLNAVTKTADTENIFNVGAVAQESITNCLGVTYFYSGTGIYQTDGTFPQLISRIGVQDYIDAIADPKQVYAWSDSFNVYFSIGDITLTVSPEDIRTFTNVVLKFSPRDQNWQIFTYNQHLAQTSTFGPEPTFGMTLLSTTLPALLTTEYDGYISFMNSDAISDDGKAIPYFLETQEQEFGNRAHTKNISNQLVTFNRNGGDGMFLVKQNDGNFKTAKIRTNKRVNVGTDVNFEGQYFTFRWEGQAIGQRPIFEGYHLPTITDLGVSLNSNIPN